MDMEENVFSILVGAAELDAFGKGTLPVVDKTELLLNSVNLVGTGHQQEAKEITAFGSHHTNLRRGYQTQKIKGGWIERKGTKDLLLAAAVADINNIWALLQNNANVNFKDDQDRTALHYATINGHAVCVNKLTVNDMDSSHRTALHYASTGNHAATVKKLLEDQATVDAKDDLKNTPFIFAAYRGHEVIVKMLLKKGADRTAKNAHGLCAPMFYRRHVYELFRSGGSSVEVWQLEGKWIKDDDEDTTFTMDWQGGVTIEGHQDKQKT